LSQLGATPNDNVPHIKTFGKGALFSLSHLFKKRASVCLMPDLVIPQAKTHFIPLSFDLSPSKDPFCLLSSSARDIV
jgi:hypothetical protein